MPNLLHCFRAWPPNKLLIASQTFFCDGLHTASQSNKHQLFSQSIYKLMIFNLVWQIGNWWGKHWSTPVKLTSLLKRCTSTGDCPPHPPKRISQAPSLAFLWQYLKHDWDLIAIFFPELGEGGKAAIHPQRQKKQGEEKPYPRAPRGPVTEAGCSLQQSPTPTSAPNIQDFLKLKFGNTVQLQAKPEMSEQYWHTLNSAIFNTSPCTNQYPRLLLSWLIQQMKSMFLSGSSEWPAAGAPEQKQWVKEPLPSVPQPMQ